MGIVGYRVVSQKYVRNATRLTGMWTEKRKAERMKIKLKKTHKFYSYAGKNPVDVWDAACENFECFSPHNFPWRRQNGLTANDFRCNHREREGCPIHTRNLTENPIKRKVVLDENRKIQ